MAEVSLESEAELDNEEHFDNIEDDEDDSVLGEKSQ